MTLVCSPTGRTRLSTLLVVWTLALAAVGVAFAADYVVRPGDVLTVNVMRHPEMSVDEVLVTDDGKIHLPVAGELPVAGMTVREATDEVTRRLSERLVHPEVTISVRRAEPEQAYALGRVTLPGVYALKPGWRITELLAAAGGLIPQPRNAAGALLRSDGTVLEIDIEAVLADAGSEANVLLRPGDVLNVTKPGTSVTVIGAVLVPGSYVVPPEAGLVEVLAKAGGVLPRARLSLVALVRADGESKVFDLSAALLDGSPAPQVVFADGDIVTVPLETGMISVLGAVSRPGHFELSDDPDLRVSDAIAKAGDLSTEPDLVDASLFRASGEVVELDMVAILLTGSAEANLSMISGDIISVSARTITVQVLGEVANPGSYKMTQGARVLNAIAMARGATENAALTTVSVRHSDGTIETVDVLEAFLGAGEIADTVLRDQDVVVVQEETASVAVLGAVAKPGYFRIDPHDPPTVTGMLALAGGPTEDARLSTVGVVRGGLSSGERLTVDVERVLKTGDLAEDMPVESRDVIFVSDCGFDWDIVFGALRTVAALGRWLID